MRNIFLLILIVFFTSAFSQEKQLEPPRLVVGIKVDGLQAEHLQKMWNYFTPGGFRKILSNSAVAERMQHNIVPAGNASDIATIMTGTYPFFHGVSSDNFYQRKENQIVSAISDKSQVGIGTKEKYSANRLLASTFADELILNNSLSQVHSVGIDPEVAIMFGGHAATSVTWIDDTANRWVTTAYYPKGLSRWADMMNVDGSFKKITNAKWTPSASINTYQYAAVSGSKTTGFSYSPLDRQKGNSSISILKNTPAANLLVTDLARTIFERERLGVDNNTDLLLLQFTVKIPNQIGSSLISAEQEDMYIRLDRNLQTLLSVITSRVGAERMLVFMIGDAAGFHSPVVLEKNQIPAGLFNADRALALLNTYLMAVYGQEKWVSGYYGKNIFLNKKKIEDNKLNLNEFQNMVTEFMSEFEGVQTAYSTQDILSFSGDLADVRLKYKNSYHKNMSGDIAIVLLPGWVEVDNEGRIVGGANSSITYVPFYLMGNGIKPQQLTQDCSTVDIAPTLCDLTGVANPNAAIGKKIKLINE